MMTEERRAELEAQTNAAPRMGYTQALLQIQAAARERDLGVKTYCLVYLDCWTVPEAVEKLRRAAG